jgi:hypothetical protein
VRSVFRGETLPYFQRGPYYNNFVLCPTTVVDGTVVNYLQVVDKTAVMAAMNRQSGCDLTGTLGGTTLSGSVQNTSGGDLTGLKVRVFRLVKDDALYPLKVSEIISEGAITDLADGASDTYNVTGITLAANEKLAVFVQSDGNKEVFHAIYVE